MVLIVLTAIMLSSCAQGNVISKNDFSDPVYSSFSLSVYHKGDQYYVCNGFGESFDEYLIFSQDRTLLNQVNIVLSPIHPSKVDSSDILKSFLGKNMDDIEDAFGPYHFNLGSGISKPSYITSDGYLITFVLFTDNVATVAKIDLLTGQAEEYSIRETLLH